MKKNFTLLMMLIASFLFSTNVMAQFKYDITEEVKPDYATTNVEFSLAEVAAQLECSVEDLVAALDEWKSSGYPETTIFALENPDGTVSTTHSADYGGYYMNKDGSLDWWGSNGYWYSQLSWDAENDKLYIMIGQSPNKPLTAGDYCKCLLSINLNGNKATFEISLTIIASEGIDKTPVTTWADLEIVGQTTYSRTQVPNNEWYNEPNQVDTKGIAELLGIDPEYMAEKFHYMLYAKVFDTTNETWNPELTNTFTATPSPGFWFSTGVWDEVNQKESAELTHGSYGTNNKFWVASLAYMSEVDSVYCTIGQYPEAWQLGENHTADIYIVYGEKAYVITYSITVDVNDLNPITNYNKLGSETITLSRNPRNGWELPDTCAIDMTKILNLFAEAGSTITPDDLTLYATDEYGSISDEYSTDSIGFWFTPEGAMTFYSAGSKGFYVDYVLDKDNNKCFAIGNTPDVFTGGEKCGATLYFINGSNYYEFIIDMEMEKTSYTLETCEIIEKDLVVELVPSASVWEIGKTDASDIAELLGTSTGTLYGIALDSTITNNYTVSEATTYGGGGFWMSPDNEDGYAFADGYSGTGSFAIWYYQDQFTWFTIPGFRQPGEQSQATFYIANLWDGIAVKLNVTLKFVNEIKTYNGSEEIIIAGRDPETDDCVEMPIDMTNCYNVLGCTEEEFFNEGFLGTYTRDGELSNYYYDSAYGFQFDSEGFACDDFNNLACHVDITEGIVRAFIQNDEDVDKEFKVTIVASYNNKDYAFFVTINTDKATSIKTIETSNNKDGHIYDLSGRKVNNPSKGIYIRNGKKFIVK